MREMHKWKDKVELSLDNRQIFFLFFGLSVVGCFVFALGVMVGRRVSFDPAGEVAALSENSLSLLEGEGEAEQATELSFKDGLKEPAIDGVPPTRDPNAPPLPELPEDEAEPEGEDEVLASASASAKKTDKHDDAAVEKESENGKEKAKAPAPKKAAAAPDPSAPIAQKYTLQMKAFGKQEEAESFAAKLKENGHDARVESHEVKGRLWHRVRVGTYDNWADGLAAKENFESSEKIIAYVVRL
jgi:cell division septation protein DedD